MSSQKTKPQNANSVNSEGSSISDAIEKATAKPEALHQSVYETLRHKIITGEFAPGRAVTVRGLAEQLGVSTMPVREAIRRLVAERALDLQSNRRVTLPTMTKDRFEELLEVRLLLEPRAAVKALPFIDEETLERLRAIDKVVDESLEEGVVEDYLTSNYTFHMTLYSAGGSEIMVPLIESIWLQSCPFLRLMISRAGTSNMEDFHRAALEAIREKDADKLHEAIANDIREGMDLVNEYTL